MTDTTTAHHMHEDTHHAAAVMGESNAADDESRCSDYTGTYSPEDNKLRLYSISRLDDATYQRIKAAGFHWAPKQELFVAPMWTPLRHDLLLELCGEIDAEDISMGERAAERADRFANRSQRRAGEAVAARAAVDRIAENIPFGQPILVGHHSERRARKDAQRIENNMRRAISAWDDAAHWKRRAAGALQNADYKGRADVRHRRIKGLEADARKQQKNIDEAETLLNAWAKELSAAAAQQLAGYSHISKAFPLADYPREAPKSQYEGEVSIYHALEDGIINEQQAKDIITAALTDRLQWSRRWLDHYNNRLIYERAMLNETGGIAADQFDIKPGGQVLVRGEWVAVKRVTRKDGKIISVSTNAKYVSVRGIEEVKDYRPPNAEQAAAAENVAKLPPMCNYPGEGFHHMTNAEWTATHKDYKGSRELGTGAVRPGGFRPDLKNTDAAADSGRHRVRSVVRRGGLVAVYLTDAKRTDPPAAPATPAAPAPQLPTPERDISEVRPRAQPADADDSRRFDTLRDQLREGVQVVSAPQLFPTPPELAARMVELAGLAKGMKLLEPSAGTGAILGAVRVATGGSVTRTGIEINARLCDHLRIKEAGAEIYNRDFLECGDELGTFDAILMNPPFANGQDIAHILHAKKFLKPGGVLIAICANSARQNEVLRPMIEQNRGTWEPLPSGTFQQSGTMVSSVLMLYRYHQ